MISALFSLLLFGSFHQCKSLSSAYTALEPLITPHFFQSMNPHIHTAITTTLLKDEIIIPPQIISIPLIGNIELNVTTFKITSLDWYPSSGLYYQNQVLEYWAKIDSDIYMEYVTNSHWILPSGKTAIHVSDLTVNIRLRFAFDAEKQILVPVFDKVDVFLRDFKIWTSRSWINWITSRFTILVKKNVVTKIEHAITDQLPKVLEETSKIEFLTPDGSYHTAFTSAPKFTESGLIFDLGLFRGGKNSSLTQSNVQTKFKRSLEGFERPIPVLNTDFQPFITDKFLQDIKIIMFNSINSELLNLDLVSNNSVAIPLSSPLEVNITYFEVDENYIQWNMATDIIFIQDAIHIDIGISFHVYAKYKTNSKIILPDASFNATVQNFRIITDVAFILNQGTLSPYFKNLTITIDKLNISSSTARINFLTSFFSEFIKSRSSSKITALVKRLVPDTVSQILQSEIKVRNMGTFVPKFLKAPEISSYGMLVDMAIVKVDDEISN